MSLKEYVKKEILKKIVREENGSKYINEKDLDKLNLDDQEQKFILSLLKEEHIEIRPTLITQTDRPKRVMDHNYGEIATNELEIIDIPLKATIEFDNNGNIIFEDYSELEKFLDKEIIAKHLKIKKNNYGFDSNETSFIQTVQFNKLVRLGLSELEMLYAFKYLNKLNIKVVGISPDIESDLNIENYDYIRTFKESEKKLYDSSKNDEQRIVQYQQTEDILLRNDIIENNLRLVSFVAYKYSIITGIDIHELESFGYEGLIYAIEKFDASKGYKFSSYAVPCIRGFILRGIPKIKGFKNSEFYSNFISCKKVVEEVNCISLEEEPKLLRDVFDLMIQTGRLMNNNYNDFVKLVSISKPLLMENMDDIEDDYIMEDEILEKVSNENLIKIIDTAPSLKSREKKILKLRYGLNDGVPKTLEEVAKIFGVSKERIREIERKIFWKARLSMIKVFGRDWRSR